MVNTRLEQVVEETLASVGSNVVLGLPLGLGKPNRLVNAFFRRACEDSDVQLSIITALSLDLPRSKHWLEERLMGPIVERQFGRNYPRLAYLEALEQGPLPDNIELIEFYFQSGAALGKPAMQRHYISSNYTHVARDIADRGVNVVAQLIAGPSDGRYSLSCNPDVSLDLKRRLDQDPGRRCLVLGHCHPDLPYMVGDAEVDPTFFDTIIDQDPDQRLFALPRMPISVQDHAVGFHASRLVADGGTLQIGIGSLSDALVHSLILRHKDNDAYRRQIERSVPDRVALDEHDRFSEGLFGASEMFMDGFMHLHAAGILKREVFDELDVQRRANDGEAVADADSGALMEGGFFLGSEAFYRFLRDLDDQQRPRFRMHGVGRINQLYGGNELLEIAQRRRARFINTCMMVTATGAAVSDGLKDHQVVSGVGGQYNFVAMAHAMDDGRSILMLRATRGEGSDRASNIVWEYPHVTIPRHLRDLVVTEYGVADLRGRTDEECIQAMVGIMDAQFQDELVDRARSAGKLDPNWRIPDRARRNRPEWVSEQFSAGTFPEYPFGSDFTPIEQRLIPALQRLKALSRDKWGLLLAALRADPASERETLARLGLDRPKGWSERFYARLIASAL
ncbi:MAG: acetyl-CoA hydrolase [Gammaproteobacteria bacterium]|jgi:acyl-CoA hydrolase|nr:acetyl-CoA hydrolase [Gammaproteobacteria bacterium]